MFTIRKAVADWLQKVVDVIRPSEGGPRPTDPK